MYQYENDKELINGFQKGAPAADTQVFQRFFRSMCLLAESLTGELPAAEDIVAETFIRLFGKRREFAGMENIKAFLYVSVRNASLSFNTTRKRHAAAHEQLAAQQDIATAPAPAEELEMMRAALLEDIYQEIEALPHQCKTICKMIFLKGMSTQAIAEALGIHPQTVRTQKARGIQLLKTQLFHQQRFLAWSLLISCYAPLLGDH